MLPNPRVRRGKEEGVWEALSWGETGRQEEEDCRWKIRRPRLPHSLGKMAGQPGL